MKNFFNSTLSALAIFLWSSHVSATPISTCQALSAAGTYELTQDIECTNGFSIGNNVTLDGQGHSVTYTGSSDLAVGFSFINPSGALHTINYENVTVRNIHFRNYSFVFRGVVGHTTSTSIVRNLTLENIETSGGQSQYNRGAFDFGAWMPGFTSISYNVRYLENATFRNITINSPYGYFRTGYLLNSIVDGMTFYGGSPLGSSMYRFGWSGLDSTIQNVSFTSDSAGPPPTGGADRYLMASLCHIDPLGYPRPASPSNDPILYQPRCAGMRLRNVTFLGPAPRYDLRMGGTFHQISGGTIYDEPGYGSATLEDSEIRRYSIQASSLASGDPLPTELTFKRSSFGSIAVSRTFSARVTGENLFSSSPESEFIVENNRFKTPESGPLAGSARLTFENLPLCWNQVQIHRNGQPCGAGICTEVERFGTRAIFDVSAGGDYSLFALTTHPECGAGGEMCSEPWDFNRDGVVNVSDIFAFLSAWFAHAGPL